MSGVGGVALAAQEMNRVQRELNDHLRRSRSRRDNRYARLSADEPMVEAPERFENACFFLCDNCGFLSHSVGTPCDACGHKSWIDLGHQATAHNLRDHEERQRGRTPWWIKLILATILVLLATLTSIIFAKPMFAWNQADDSGLIEMAGLCIPFIVLAYVMLLRPVSVLLMRYWPPRPYRWRLPLTLPPPGTSSESELEGQVEAQGDDLVAPFSGWPCLACRVRVLFDVAGDARPPEWVLDEMVTQDLSISGRMVEADRILVTGPFEAISPESLGATQEELSRFLLGRGLFSTDGEFTLFEARIDAQQKVRVIDHGPDRAVFVSQIRA